MYFTISCPCALFWSGGIEVFCCAVSWVLYQTQPRRQAAKTSLKRNQLALFQNSSILFHLIQFVNFFKLNSKGLYWGSEKEEENRCLLSTFFIKRKIRMFHVVVVQQQQRNLQKNLVSRAEWAEWSSSGEWKRGAPERPREKIKKPIAFFRRSCCRRHRRRLCLSSLTVLTERKWLT